MSHTLLIIAAFLVAVFVLVTVHEFGHFWVARRLGFKVLRFSVGFGRPLWKRVGRDGTEYVLAVVPLGGYVKLLDEREGPVASEDLAGAFTRRPHWQRIAVLLAGPAANFLFAILVLAAMFFAQGRSELRAVLGPVKIDSPAARAGVHAGDEILAVGGDAASGRNEVVIGLLDAVSSGAPVLLRLRDASGAVRELELDPGSTSQRRELANPSTLLPGLGLEFVSIPVPAMLGLVEPDGPAARAGLQRGDTILSVNGQPVHDFMALAELVKLHAGETIAVRYLRNGQESGTRVEVASVLEDGVRVGRVRARPFGPGAIPPALLLHVDYGPVGALAAATREAWSQTALQARLLWRMFAGRLSVKNLSGPLTIAQLAGDSARAGPAEFLNFLVLVSLALGFMNLLPIPILDGGQAIMQSIEWLKGSPLSERAQVAGQQVGIALVMLLVGIALYNDIARQFG
jgi:regulator of sigma E protease